MCRSTKYVLLVFIITISAMAAAQYPATYVADSNTLHLYHFDTDASDSAGILDLTLASGAALGTSLSGFGNAVNTYDGITGSGPYAGDNSSKIMLSELVGSDGAFTFEAIVKPMVGQGSIPNHMEIICLEDSDSSAGERGFQFRINNDGTLRFQTLAGIVSNFDASISFTTGTWYHAAITYNGHENTAGNLRLYWTEIAAETTVQEVGSFQLTQDLNVSVDGYFSIGNELRPSAYSENFEGLIDEVRISDIQRTALEMLYATDSDTLHYYRFESNGQDSVTTNSIDLSAGNGATFSEASVDNYGTAINTYKGTTGDGPYAGDNTNKKLISDLVGADGAFTFEAWLKPMMLSSETPNNMQIICMEDDDSSIEERGFHFRITDDGSLLQFTSLAGTYYSFSAPVTYSPDTWYHAAVTYNGNEDTPDNLKLYWTRIQAYSSVQEIGSFQAPSDLQSTTDGFICVGNELRSTGGYSENFEGLIDEVRISQIARSDSNLLYLSNDGLPSVFNNPESITINAGETAAFECIFTAETMGQAVWYKVAEPADVQIQDSDTRVSLTLDYDHVTLEYTSHLTIENCEVADLGDYYLAVSNLAGQVVYSEPATLTVQGLWANWTLNNSDYDGTYYKEVIGGKDALVESIPVFATGADKVQEGAIEINSGNGWAVVDSNNPLALPSSFTISYWANWQDQLAASGDLLIDSGDGNLISVSNGLKADQTWQHICTVFDGSKCCLYLDGVLAAETDWDIPEGLVAELNIGSAEMGNEVFNGYLDDIRIYNYAMDDFEVAQLRYDFAGFRSCINSYQSSVDWSGPQDIPDCMVNIYDLNAFAYNFLSSSVQYDISGPSDQPDGIVSLYDFALLSTVWLDCGLFPNCL